MKCQYISDKFKVIEDSLNKAKNSSVSDPELSSMLSSYSAVLISGIYEDVIEYLFIQRAAKNGDQEISGLVKVLIDRVFRNPEYDKIENLVKALDSKYTTTLNSKIAERSKEALNSIVRNKNKVAHGELSNATLSDIELYHKDATIIFEGLENILL